MATHSEVITALGKDQWNRLQKSGLPLLVTNELLSIWLEGWPIKFRRLVQTDSLLPMLLSLKLSLRQCNEYRGDPELMHVSLAEKMGMAGLPLTL